MCHDTPHLLCHQLARSYRNAGVRLLLEHSESIVRQEGRTRAAVGIKSCKGPCQGSNLGGCAGLGSAHTYLLTIIIKHSSVLGQTLLCVCCSPVRPPSGAGHEAMKVCYRFSARSAGGTVASSASARNGRFPAARCLLRSGGSPSRADVQQAFGETGWAVLFV